QRAYNACSAVDGMGRSEDWACQAGILGCLILDSTSLPARSSSWAASFRRSETCLEIFSTYFWSSRLARLIGTLLAAPSTAARAAETAVTTSDNAFVDPFSATSRASRSTLTEQPRVY